LDSFAYRRPDLLRTLDVYDGPPVRICRSNFRLGDVRELDFADESFDRIRTDRVLIFVPEIEKATTEMVRVLRPGGRIVASELDHELFFVDRRFPEINQKISAAFAASNPQPRLGRQLTRLFAAQGLRNVRSMPRVIRPPYQTFRIIIGGFLTAALARGELVQPEVDMWLNDLEALAEAGVFSNGTVVFTASGEKPI
jgi:SAM-dependent methyltransferase